MTRNRCYLTKAGLEALERLAQFVIGKDELSNSDFKRYTSLDRTTIGKILQGNNSVAVQEKTLETIFRELSEHIDINSYEGATELHPGFYIEATRLCTERDDITSNIDINYSQNSGEHYITNNNYLESLSEKVFLNMVRIPEGKFWMGSPETEQESYCSERPLHEVSIQSFYIGKYIVTKAQWEIVANFDRIERDINVKSPLYLDKDHPMQNICWDDAIEFCKRLSKHTGDTYRLPSEAEWEYACRGGTNTPFHFGKSITSNEANYNCKYSYDSGPKGEFNGQTNNVSDYAANPFGLHDVHGNVWEMCSDTWHSSYNGAPCDGSAWIGNSSHHVVRGGSFMAYPGRCRSASRDYNTLPRGFRVVCELH